MHNSKFMEYNLHSVYIPANLNCIKICLQTILEKLQPLSDNLKII